MTIPQGTKRKIRIDGCYPGVKKVALSPGNNGGGVDVKMKGSDPLWVKLKASNDATVGSRDKLRALDADGDFLFNLPVHLIVSAADVNKGSGDASGNGGQGDGPSDSGGDSGLQQVQMQQLTVAPGESTQITLNLPGQMQLDGLRVLRGNASTNKMRAELGGRSGNQQLLIIRAQPDAPGASNYQVQGLSGNKPVARLAQITVKVGESSGADDSQDTNDPGNGGPGTVAGQCTGIEVGPPKHVEMTQGESAEVEVEGCYPEISEIQVRNDGHTDTGVLVSPVHSGALGDYDPLVVMVTVGAESPTNHLYQFRAYNAYGHLIASLPLILTVAMQPAGGQVPEDSVPTPAPEDDGASPSPDDDGDEIAPVDDVPPSDTSEWQAALANKVLRRFVNLGDYSETQYMQLCTDGRFYWGTTTGDDEASYTPDTYFGSWTASDNESSGLLTLNRDNGELYKFILSFTQNQDESLQLFLGDKRWFYEGTVCPPVN